MSRGWRWIAACAVCVLAGRSATAVSAQEGAGGVVRGEIGAELDGYLRRLEAFGFSGAVLVSRRGEVVLSRGYGLADTVRRVPVTPRTIFFSASISKQFTAAAVMKLADEGKLSPADSLGALFPGVPRDKSPITVHQLLTHSAGLPGEHGSAPGAAAGDREDWVRSLFTRPLEYPPGTRASYSNASFSLLAAIVERASGRPFDEYLHDHLFRPAALASTGFSWKPAGLDTTRIAYGLGGGVEGDPRRFAMGWGARGASGVMTTVEDLWRWEAALTSGRVLSDSAQRRLTQRYVPIAPGVVEDLDYGYGWRVQRMPRGTQVIWGSGIHTSFSAMYRRYVDEGIVVIFLSNVAFDSFVARDALFPVTREGPIGQILTGAAHESPPWFLSEAPATLARYAGEYRLPSGGVIEVHAHGDHLRLVPRTQAAASLLLTEPQDTLSPPYDSLNARVRQALAGSGADTTVLGVGPIASEGLVHPSPTTHLGRLLGPEWLVTLPVQLTGATHRATTYGMLRFERGLLPFRWRWWNGNPYGRDVGFPLGVLPPFRPQSATEFVAYSIPTQRALRVRFAMGPDGAPLHLLLPAPQGEVAATRVAPAPGDGVIR